jgi:alpha-N-arabinofuranosidase
MRMVSPDLELVACGSSYQAMPTFGEWEQTVLELAYDQIDYISLHAYYQETDGDLPGFLASSLDMDRFIDRVISIADGVGARLGSRKRIDLSFDEWNVWYITEWMSDPPTQWRRAPHLIEDTYNVADAVVVGSLLITLLRHTDRIAAACLAQLVNAIAPIRTLPGAQAWRQTTFYPFAQCARFARGDVLSSISEGDRYDSRHGEAAVVDAVATHDPETGDLTVFAINRSIDGPVILSLDTSAFVDVTAVEHSVLADPDVRAANTAEQPDRVVPRSAPLPARSEAGFEASLDQSSWNVLRFSTQPG